MILAKHVLSVYNEFMPPFFGGLPPAAIWQKTLIKYAQWEDAADRNSTQAGMTSIDKHIRIIIPKNANTQGRKYIPFREFEFLPAEQKPSYWTLKINSSIICLGDTPEITSQFPSHNIKEQFSNCLVKAIEDLTIQPILPHWEIIGI